MLLNRAVSVGSLAVVGVALLLIPARWASAQRATVNPAPDQSTLLIRRPLPKTPSEELRIPTAATGQIIVKFKDNVRARVQTGVLDSQGNVSVQPARAIMAQFELTAKQFLTWTPQRLANLENRAATVSDKAQPDLAGMIAFEGPWDNLQAAARALNDLPSVEWVSFKQQWHPMGTVRRCCLPDGTCVDATPSVCVATPFFGTPGLAGTMCADGECGPGGCCLGSTCADVFDEASCTAQSGVWQGFGILCPVSPPCPAPGTQRCCFPNTGQCSDLDPTVCGISGGTPGTIGSFCGQGECGPGPCCINGNCQNAVDEQDCNAQGGIWLGWGPGDQCTDQNIDCSAIQCGESVEFCFEAHDSPGCADQDCCELVCGLLPTCCEEFDFWDQDCVDLANLFCESPACPGTPVGNCPDRCGSPFNGDCFTPHSTGGCLDPTCCAIVCSIEPFCCDLVGGFWDGICVALADDNCGGASGSGETPDFGPLQGYLRQSDYRQQAGGAPPNYSGTSGGGWNLGGDNYGLWVINEINVDPDTGDANGDGFTNVGDQFIEIVNNRYIDLSVAGWTITATDNTGTPTVTVNTIATPAVVGAGKAIVIFSSPAPDPNDPMFRGALVTNAQTGSLGLYQVPNNPALRGIVTLTDDNGRVVTSYSWGQEAMNDAAIARNPDVTGFDVPGLTPVIQCQPGGMCAWPGTRSDDTPFSFDRYLGLNGTSRELFEVYGIGATTPPGSTDYDDIRFNSRGKGINVAVIEWSYYLGHEDLSVINEPGQTIVIIPENSPDHATACLGIINGQENGKGVTGIAPEAQAWFFPLFSAQEGSRDEAAFLSAYETLNAGDVVSCSFGPGDPFWNLNNEPVTWTLMRMGSDLGITTCVAAGNACQDLSQVNNLGDSGAVVVGAGQPSSPWCRLTFSNFFQNGDFNDDSNVIHCQAWGSSVTTAGYGFLFNPNDDTDRSYTAGFNGTSAACPQIAGLAACLQGLAKQFYGIHLGPPQIRAALASGRAQCLIQDPDDLPGFPAIVPCGPDTDPDSGPNKIGIYPVPGRGEGTSSWSVLNNSGFDQSPLLDDLVIITGNLVQGNVFSVKGADDNYLIIESAQANPNGVGTPGHNGGVALGQTTMFQLTGHMESPNVQSLSLEVEAFVDNSTGIQLIYMFDYQNNTWLTVGVAFLGVDDIDTATEFIIENASRFIRPSDLQVSIRLQTIGLGIGANHRSFTDWVNISRNIGNALVGGP